MRISRLTRFADPDPVTAPPLLPPPVDWRDTAEHAAESMLLFYFASLGHQPSWVRVIAAGMGLLEAFRAITGEPA